MPCAKRERSSPSIYKREKRKTIRFLEKREKEWGRNASLASKKLSAAR